MRSILILLVLAVCSDAQAGPLRNRRATYQHTSASRTVSTPQGTWTSTSERTVIRGDGAADALAEVNSQRSARGLPPYIWDAGLTQAAMGAATFRAQRLLFGHSANDFQFLPAGSSAAAAGCAAYPASYGFMACATYDRYTFAGAAVAYGADGRRFCHLFVR